MTGAAVDRPTGAPGREWGVMAILLLGVVGALYVQARASCARLHNLELQSAEISSYFSRIRPQYDTAYGMCDQLSRMAASDRDAAWILKKHGIQLSPASPSARK